MKKKIREAESIMMELITQSKNPILCFGGGKESVSILMLARHLGVQDQLTVRLSNTNPRSADGIIQGLEVLIRELGFRIVVTSGLEPKESGSPTLGEFDLDPQLAESGFEIFKYLSPGQTLLPSTNWAQSIYGADGVMIGWRKTDRPPRDALAVGMGPLRRCKDGRLFALPLYSWEVEDLREFLGLQEQVTQDGDSFSRLLEARRAGERNERTKRATG